VLYRVALSLSGCREDAEDIVQEAYARLLSKERWISQEDEVGYLVRTVRNVFLSQCAARARRPQTVCDELAYERAADPSSPSAEDIIAQRDLLAVIATLPQPQREVLVAVDVAGLSYREAAAELDVPIGTVMSRLYRARERVAACLSPA
jgi:RNA polymerase sigma-70 factor, ECF subfamily